MELLVLIIGLFGSGAALIQLEHRMHSTCRSEREHTWLKFGVYVLIVSSLLLVRLLGFWPAAGLLCIMSFLALRELYQLMPDSLAFVCAASAGVVLGLSHLLLPIDGGGFETWASAILLVSATDAFSQLSGKLFGQRKLCPNLSPGKTVEGLIGGFLAAGALAGAIGFLLPELSWAERLALGLVTASAAVTGDLLFSWLKRRAGVKDFSTLIPAHGGVLDRVDSLVLGAPAFFWTLETLAT